MNAAELGSDSGYREAARILSEWTPVDISHTMVSVMIKRVGEAQSNHPVLNQLDDYHVKQAINRAFGWKMTPFKEQVQHAIKNKHKDDFTLWTDTFESILKDKKEIKKILEFRTYIMNHWDGIFDSRTIVKDVSKDTRSLGCIESRQRHISFRMKSRSMHWSAIGAESMVKRYA